MNFFKYIKNFFKKEKIMAKKLKKYRVSPDESLGLAMSVVDKPAVASDFIYLSEQKVENFVAVEKPERRMIYGCALRPNFEIYRNNGAEEYILEFDEDAVSKISKNFFKMGFQSNWTAAHKDEVEGLTITESWIKEDMYKDKSIALGMDDSLPVGSWIIGCYCENDDVWEAVKNGTYHGFSIEAVVGVEEFEKQMKKDEVETTPSVEELAEESGFTNVEEYKKEVEAIREELEEQTPTAEAPIEPPVTPTEPSKDAEPITTPTEGNKAPEEPKNEPAEKDNHLEELINNLKEEIEALKGVNKDLTSKVKSLEKEPSAKPISTNGKSGGKGDTYAQWRETMRQMIG